MRWRPLPTLLTILAAIVAAWLATHSMLGKRFEFGIADLGMQFLTRSVESDIVIVGIDARSLEALREWPWPRRYHAELIEKLAPASPAQLFLDIDFSSSSNPVDDLRLQSALANWQGPAIVLPAFYQYASPADSSVVLTQPVSEFRPHVTVASVNLSPAVDGLVRFVRTSWASGGHRLPSVAAMLGGQATTDDSELWIDYSIDPASFTFISYADVLANRIPAVHFADKTVFVGATAIELGDMVAVPVHRSLPGVIVQALAYETTQRELLRPLPRAAYWLFVTIWAALLVLCYQRQSWRVNIAVLALATSAVAATALAAYALLDTVIAVLPFIIAAVAGYLLVTLQSLETETLRAIAYALGFKRRDALLKSIVLSSTDCIVCIDESGMVKTANPAADRLFGSGPGKLVGTSLLRFVPSLLLEPGSDQPKTFQDLVNRITEVDAVAAPGNTFPIEVSVSRVRLDDEHLYTAIIRDISERKAQYTQLQFQATHDPLTTLPNRPALAAHLDTVLASHNNGEPVALMMIDLNRFKEVNDTLGHNVGDYVLYEVARRLADVARGKGFIARIGGDEFALIVDHFLDTEVISSLSQELLDCLKDPIHTEGVAIDVGLSIGIALFPQNARDAETLFKQSDVAMYVAKRSGSGFEYYCADSDEHSVRRLAIASKLRRAIAGAQLQLHYQPQVNLGTGKVDSVEALLRWNDPEFGVVRPDEFIGVAEATDMIQPLTEWTLIEAFRQCAEWRSRGLEVRFAINLSARMLQSESFPVRLAELIRKEGVDVRSIELEITESAMMVDPERALRIVRSLHDLGVLISIDDYGTGFSSLAYLRDLPVHALKLDKSFVMNMREHKDDRVIVESTVQMAHALNLKVVAEGVETAADAALLREYGYDYAQGFLYSPAMESNAMSAWIRHFNQNTNNTLSAIAQRR